ncbi:type II-A CRISPR-associated protein Csn2 [Fructilactobacillus myrtifloralis]|uniref:Type II-A CRISPR-associated protein Csn2 n=1 Tax=Fructilactobacillus myrtifloralis TaxID=2940301 RepID=A0ABY5BNI5_9LACO|nr:type II-A CRISPR-associated protein Csn2 [Fructilactobacillus myrtifloralis]USS84805.1 type II-A CRISPR-associated protein Csn2 [Fructilactobacillus myrtifloralis]
MKLTLYPNAPFEINAGVPTVIRTNNQAFYTSLSLGLQSKQDIVLSDNDEVLELNDYLQFIGNVVTNPDLFTPFKLKIEREILENLNEKERQRLYQLDCELKSIFLGSAYLEDFPLTINDEWDVKKQYKYCGINFLHDAQATPYDIIKEVLNLYNQFNAKKLLVLADLFNYLEEAQQLQIFQLIKKLELHVLLLDFSWQPYSQLLEECRYYSVDKDFVIFER